MDNYDSCSNYWNEMDGIGVVLMGAVHSDNDRVGDDETLYKNQEGYRDPTAGKAIQDASRIPHHVKEAHKALKDIASLLGFEVLVLRDRKTGRVYRWKQ